MSFLFIAGKSFLALTHKYKKMKSLIFFAALVFFSLPLYSQSLGINTSGATANASAMLDVDVSGLAAKKGLLIPRVTAAQRTAMNPLSAAAQGLMVYQTDGVQGFYYNSSTTTTPAWNYVATSTFSWATLGNAGTTPGTNFIGTTDNQDLVFKLDNTEYLRFQKPGRIVPSNFSSNIAVGLNTLLNTTGTANLAMADFALQKNSSGNDNIAIGYLALFNNTTGSNNTAIGTYSMETTQTGSHNTAIGKNSGYQFNGGSNNCFFGSIAGAFSTGGNNTYLGQGSGTSASGSGNVFLGYNVGQSVSASNRLFIDNSNTATPLIYGEFDNDIVGIGGKLGVATNSPLSTLEVNGTFATTVKTAQVAGTNNPDNTAAVWFYSSGAGTITLPAANTCSGRRYVVVNQTGASVTTSAYFNLAAASVTVLANSASVEIISDGTNWRQVK